MSKALALITIPSPEGVHPVLNSAPTKMGVQMPGDEKRRGVGRLTKLVKSSGDDTMASALEFIQDIQRFRQI